jgi:hypothetical protein
MPIINEIEELFYLNDHILIVCFFILHSLPHWEPKAHSVLTL